MTEPQGIPIMSDLLSSSPVKPAKPGWKTSEFWLKIAATGLSALFASGLITSNTTLAIAGIAAAELGSFGYTVLRTQVKS
jgi:hypothetical protein